jgi:hypothetical protein
VISSIERTSRPQRDCKFIDYFTIRSDASLITK